MYTLICFLYKKSPQHTLSIKTIFSIRAIFQSDYFHSWPRLNNRAALLPLRFIKSSTFEQNNRQFCGFNARVPPNFRGSASTRPSDAPLQTSQIFGKSAASSFLKVFFDGADAKSFCFCDVTVSFKSVRVATN